MKKLRAGIALSENNLHCSLVRKEKYKWRILATYHNTFSDDNFRQILPQIRAQMPRASRCVILGLPYHRVLMKEIRIDPRLKDEEIYIYLQNQAISLYAKPAQHWFMDYQECHFEKEHSSLTPIRGIAASREEISRLQQDFRSSGLILNRLDVEVLSLSRLMPTLEFYTPEKIQGLIWLKKTEVLFLTAKAGTLIYAKRSSFSGQPLNKIIPDMIQFYHALYPDHILDDIFFINENNAFTQDLYSQPSFKTPSLNQMIWDTDFLEPGDFCSLGLTLYDY